MLRDARISAKLTQRDVASRLDKPPSFPHKVETGERELNVIGLMDYCSALGIDFVTFSRQMKEEIERLRA
jgi:transcriptional regulator with XRE-family HTH domain